MSVIITALTSHRWEFAVTNCRLYWYNTAMEITYCVHPNIFFSWVALAWVESKEELNIQRLIKNSFLLSFSFIFIFLFMSNLKLLIRGRPFDFNSWGRGWVILKKISSKHLSEEKNCMQQKCNRKLMGKKGEKMSCPPDC